MTPRHNSFLGEAFRTGTTGSRVAAAVSAVVVLALAIGAGVGLTGPLAIFVGLVAFIVIGAGMEVQKRRRLREQAFVGGGPRAYPYVDPITDFGIHPWLGGDSESELPSFVKRRAMEEALEGLREQRFVILTGPEESGKSRLAYEAAMKSSPLALVAREAPRQGDDPLIALMNDRRGFKVMQEDQVLLLTDLGVRLNERAVSGESIREWLERNPTISVIATLDSEDLAEIEKGGRPVMNEMKNLKQQARVVPVRGRLAAEELEDAAEKFPQVSPEQLPTLTKYLAGGPLLQEVLEEAEHERSLAYGIVCAVADWRRAGMRTAAPLEFVRKVALHLQQDQTADFDEEMAWALEARGPSAALIYGVEGEEGPGYVPDNIVVGVFDERRPRRKVDEFTWRAVKSTIQGRLGEGGADETQVAADLLTVGEAALAQGQPEAAYRVLAAVSVFGDLEQQRRAVELITSDHETALVESRRGDGIIQRLKPVKRLAEGRRFKAGKPLLGSSNSDDSQIIAWIYRRHTMRNFLRILVLGLADMFSTALGLFVGLGIRALLSDDFGPFTPGGEVRGAFISLWAAVTLFVFASARLYRKEGPRARISGIAAAVFAFVAFGFVVTVTEGFNVGVAILTVVGGGLFAAGLDFLLRFAYDQVSRHWVWNHGLETRTLLIGSPPNVAVVERALPAMSRPSMVVGYLVGNVTTEDEFDVLPEASSLGSSDDLRVVASREGVGRVIIVDPDMNPAERQKLADRCHELGLPVEAVASIADIRIGSGAYILGQPLILIPMFPLWQRNTWFFVKRSLDFIVALLLLVLLSPLLAVVTLLVRLEGRPVLVHTWRAGLGGEPFYMYRFRTGIGERRSKLDLLEPESLPPVARSRLGRFLRSHGIDELPQLFNILRGHMSLVGPRPLELSHHVRLSEFDLLRYVVKPGATGPWQVCSRSSLTYSELTGMDMAYLRRWSIFTDLEILVRTAKFVLTGRKSVPSIERQEPEPKGGLGETLGAPASI